MGGLYNTYGEDEKYLQNISPKAWKEQTIWKT
jgi:hypothetical protein